MLTVVDRQVLDAAKAKVAVAIEDITQSFEIELAFTRNLAASLETAGQDATDASRLVDLAKEINSLGVRALWRAASGG